MTFQTTSAVETAGRHYAYLRTKVAAAAAANDGIPLEDHLRSPVQALVESVAEDLGYPKLVLAGEISGAVAGARPDYTVMRGGLVVGHIELKAPGAGVAPDEFTGHNLDQWLQLRHLPNLLYTDGIDWLLWQDGQQVARATAWTAPGKGIAGAKIDAADLMHLLDAFCADSPQAPATARELARTTARLCRVLRNQILGALESGGSKGLEAVAEDWRSLLFPEASDAEFADAYAQTIAFGLIAARAAGSGLGAEDRGTAGAQPAGEAEPAEIAGAAACGADRATTPDGPTADGLAADFGGAAGAGPAAAGSVAERVAQATRALDAAAGLIPTALRVLCSESAIGPIEPAVESLLSLLAATDPALLNDAGDWLYFYEDFLAQYDPDLRKESGSYYTPAELVKFMVRLVDEVLVSRLGQPSGFAGEAVTVIDPAVGTGTFLLQIIDRIASTIEERDGAGAVAGALRGAARRLVGLELQAGPYSVAQFRTGARFRRHGVDRAPRVLLADTLADPYTEEVRLGSIYEPISRERRAANDLKKNTPVMVAIGNPPYRERAKGLGGWVESGNPNTDLPPILDDWKPPADWGVGAHVYKMSNVLVYFWRWATWKVLENASNGSTKSPGVVCFVTTAGWLNGDGFQQMRAWLRQWCSEIWVVSLSPEGHQPDVPTRMFEQVQHEIAVVCAARSSETDETPATVWFREVTPGVRDTKFAELEAIGVNDDAAATWTRCPQRLRAAFKPAGEGAWRHCPSVHDLLPWSTPGVKANRGWPTAQDSKTLRDRWDELVSESDAKRKRVLFKENGPNTIERRFSTNLPDFPNEAVATPISMETNPCPTPISLSWRSFDRQWIIPDARVLDRPRPPLWEVRSSQQIHLTCIENDHPAGGPAATFTHLLPSQDHYHGRGGRAFPLWRDSTATTANIAPGLLGHLTQRFGVIVAPEDLLAYIAGVCAHPAYTAWLNEISPYTPGLRVPLTADRDYWSMAVGTGRRVVWAHTFGERCIDGNDGRPAGSVRLPDGPRLRLETGEGTLNRTLSYDTERRELRIGEGTFEKVTPAVHSYEVSGRNVVRSWFNYRRARTGNRDPDSLESISTNGWRPEWDIELLDILNALTALVNLEPEQAELLEAIIDGPQVTVADLEAAEILPVPAEAKQAPKVERKAAPAQTPLI
ncbi:MAG: N-6 DNA methylase [bacterium]|nr:N-6 DNA methylase [bacterium]